MEHLQDTLAEDVTSLDEDAAVQENPDEIKQAPQVGGLTVRDEDVGNVEGDPRQEVRGGAISVK